MISEVFSSVTTGVDACTIRVEIHIESGLFSFSVVGLPDSTVRESRERVSAAIKNSGLLFPTVKRITINLSPADIRKEGSGFDLPIAICILAQTSQIPSDNLSKYIFVGELSLDGKLRRIPGILPITMQAKEEGFEGIILPAENANEGGIVSGINVYPFNTLAEVVEFLNGNLKKEPHKINIDIVFSEELENILDFSEVKGQAEVKRAMEVAAAGGHNIIMIGLPGSGKSMLAKRLPGILPPMSLEESLETSKIHSVAGLLNINDSLITVRPFRSPHHTASDVSIVGGGPNARPGEISFAHNGVLFLDELTEFKKNVLDVLRQPLEDREVTIARSKITVKYPCNFMLVAAMNPTPAGSVNDLNRYSEYDIQKYLAKISGPILDRIDIHINVQPVKFNELSSKAAGESSKEIRKRVVAARAIQLERFKNLKGKYCNANMEPKDLKEFCKIDQAGESLLKMAMEKLNLSARAYDRILKVSRTIADLNGEENISPAHLSEAIQYRSLDRNDWI